MRYFLVVLFSAFSSLLLAQSILIDRRAGERCLEIRDSLQIMKIINLKQDTLIHKGEKVELQYNKLVKKYQNDSIQFKQIIAAKDTLNSNKDEQLKLANEKYKLNDRNHKKKELGLLAVIVGLLLLL
jgi:biopolymer transport protein ExbB/TolQ